VNQDDLARRGLDEVEQDIEEALERLRGDPSKPWYWEGNVLARTAPGLLEEYGWKLRYITDTNKGQHGIDLRCARGGQPLYIEGKGWPKNCTTS
jgi:hypothetical protein